MKLLSIFCSLAIAFGGLGVASAKPYPDRSRVPTDESFGPLPKLAQLSRPSKTIGRIERGDDVLRIAVRVDLKTEAYSLARIVRESSGTPALAQRSKSIPKWGSYRAVLKDRATGNALAHDSIGTGKEYRKLVDEITFRFPVPPAPVEFELTAENPVSGKMEKVLTTVIDPLRATEEAIDMRTIEIRELHRPTAPGTPIRMNIYAEGYLASRKSEFWKDAIDTVAKLVKNRFPALDRLHIFAVYGESQEILGSASELGFPIPVRKTFLGLYYPYWDKFDRWYHVVYPTRENQMRTAFAVAPYDHSFALVDDGGYWGMGNFRVTTAIPAKSYSSTYLLLHEIGHYFGLNEEYEEDGPTELEFAPGIDEPWSQNITFLRKTDIASLKWAKFVTPSVPLPTPNDEWSSSPPKYGAYLGGYAGSEPRKQSHKPGHNCMMEAGSEFCRICSHSIEEVLHFDAGVTSPEKR